MMKIFSDEQLSAYLDGAGDPAVCEAIDCALENDTALQERLENFRRADQLLREALDARLGAVPDRLEQIAAGNVAVARFGAKPHIRRIVQYAALAASLVIAVGVGAQLGHRPGVVAPPAAFAFGQSGLTAGQDLAQAISTAYSGEPVATNVGNISIALSFRTAQGEFCRQFQIDRSGASDTAVACRTASGWRIEGWTANHPHADSSGFTTASGPSDPAIAAIIDRLGMEKSLDRAGEIEAVKSGWRNTPH